VTVTGDSLCDQANPIIYDEIDFPSPSISLAVVSEKEGDEDKVFGGLYRLAEEDPTFVSRKESRDRRDAHFRYRRNAS
jgi:elongation factor G